MDGSRVSSGSATTVRYPDRWPSITRPIFRGRSPTVGSPGTRRWPTTHTWESMR